jgi:hypothetical protein
LSVRPTSTHFYQAFLQILFNFRFKMRISSIFKKHLHNFQMSILACHIQWSLLLNVVLIHYMQFTAQIEHMLLRVLINHRLYFPTSLLTPTNITLLPLINVTFISSKRTFQFFSHRQVLIYIWIISSTRLSTISIQWTI